ncbi:hypothetical protein [Paraflavitalea sp. CAU 1676]|uniref:hypothetical protein n=1 Tax=Paraflavitalea sp. CAU 1676 TaxID=3032598 RepID=UPI0023DCAB83|nr:hypothetical protein [Paraflavitalea sp. CAU 1676]MDF2188689.1 hypothetical protein [Paraflavitalea sp. CAU 1676]
MKKILLFILGIFPVTIYCQEIIVAVTPNSLTAQKYDNEKLIIPIEITLTLTAGSIPQSAPLSIPIAASFQRTDVPASMELNSGDYGQLLFENLQTSVEFKVKEFQQKVTVYVIVPAGLSIGSNKAIKLSLTVNGTISVTKQINIEPANDRIYRLNDYMGRNSTIQLDEVTKVTSANNILTVSGYKNGGFTKRQVILEKHQVLGIINYSYIFGNGYFSSTPFSLVSVPFKMRRKLTVPLNKTGTPKDSTYGSTAMSGITNLGVNIDLFKRVTDRYFASGKKSTHKWSIGFLITPGVEELSASLVKDTSIVGDKKSKQFYLSLGLSLSYSYNGLTFFVVPYARDYAFSTIGKQWIYNKERWWGFGIGVSPTVFSQLVNN